MSATRHLGLDLGVTNIKWAIVERSASNWRVLDKAQLATHADEGAPAVVGRLARTAAASIERWPDVRSVGVGVPGLYDPASGQTRLIINMPEPDEWVELPVAEPIAAHVGLPVFLLNDARAFGLAEFRLGAGRGADSMIGFTLGTGVGGVIAVHGRVHHGHDGTAGELGHQTIDPDGPWCGCGNRGCVEAYARADQIAAACGTDSAEAAVAAARAGDERALRGLREVGRYLGIGVASAVTVITPDKVVIGGGVAAAGELLLEAVRDELRRRVRVTSLEQVELVTAELGTWAGAIGAAVHAAERATDLAALAGQLPEPAGRAEP